MGKKKTSVANFNLVFIEGKNEHPLLTYFDEVFMPSMTAGYIRQEGESSYRFMDINVSESVNGYVLSGILVKKTVLEVKSDLDEKGNLIEKDEKIPTAPYSTFIIYLKNHRMIYAENQKGSPDLRSFRTTVQYFLNRYVREQKELLKDTGKELPIPILNVVGLPVREKLETTLKDVEKINALILRFYPLNGDLDYTGMLGGISNDLRKAVGSKRGEIILKSPKNIQSVIEIVEKSEGTVDPIFKVQCSDKRKMTIKSDTISERMELDISGDTIDEEVEDMLRKGSGMKNLEYVSEGNERIYETNKAKIIPFHKKNKGGKR